MASAYWAYVVNVLQHVCGINLRCKFDWRFLTVDWNMLRPSLQDVYIFYRSPKKLTSSSLEFVWCFSIALTDSLSMQFLTHRCMVSYKGIHCAWCLQAFPLACYSLLCNIQYKGARNYILGILPTGRGMLTGKPVFEAKAKLQIQNVIYGIDHRMRYCTVL